MNSSTDNTLRLPFSLIYCESRWYWRMLTNICGSTCFRFFVEYIQNCWITWWFHVKLFREGPHWVSQWFHNFVILVSLSKGFSLSLSLSSVLFPHLFPFGDCHGFTLASSVIWFTFPWWLILWRACAVCPFRGIFCSNMYF